MEVDEAYSINDTMFVAMNSFLPLEKDVVGDSIVEAELMKDLPTHHFLSTGPGSQVFRPP